MGMKQTPGFCSIMRRFTVVSDIPRCTKEVTLELSRGVPTPSEYAAAYDTLIKGGVRVNTLRLEFYRRVDLPHNPMHMHLSGLCFAGD